MKNTNAKPELFVLAFFLLFFISCKKEPQTAPLPTEPVQVALTQDQNSLITSENSFAFDIFNRIAAKEPVSVNLMISPLSISTALSMTLNGASGSTRDAMLNALKQNGLTEEIINNSYKSLTPTLLGLDERVKISIANSVWTEKNFAVRKAFISILTDYYSAESKPFDIQNKSAALEQINGWISDNTNGLIKNMLSEIDDNAVMFLINAIYFKGKWSSQFDQANTRQAPFFKADGTTIQVPMMKQTSNYKVYNGDGFTLAELPYGQGNFVMDILLPNEINGAAGFLTSLNDANLKSWTGKMTEKKVNVSLPKFKYAYKIELSQILSDMGMEIAFTDKADFSNISDLDLYISFVLHQSFIETNEEGTEAAAATIVGISTTSAPSDPEILNIDHPFIYLIRETETNTVLFAGRIADPTAV
jgi:serine protease inhibitor